MSYLQNDLKQWGAVVEIVKAVPFFKGLFGGKTAKPPRAHAGIVLKSGVSPTIGNVLNAIKNLTTPWESFQRNIPPPSQGAFMTSSGGFKGHDQITRGFSPQVRSALSKVYSGFNSYFAKLPDNIKATILKTDTGFAPGGHSLDWTQQVDFIPGWVGYELASDGEIGAIVTQAINRLSTAIKDAAETSPVPTPVPAPVTPTFIRQPAPAIRPLVPTAPYTTPYLPGYTPPRIAPVTLPAPTIFDEFEEPTAPLQAGIDPSLLIWGGLGFLVLMMMRR